MASSLCHKDEAEPLLSCAILYLLCSAQRLSLASRRVLVYNHAMFTNSIAPIYRQRERRCAAYFEAVARRVRAYGLAALNAIQASGEIVSLLGFVFFGLYGFIFSPVEVFKFANLIYLFPTAFLGYRVFDGFRQRRKYTKAASRAEQDAATTLLAGAGVKDFLTVALASLSVRLLSIAQALVTLTATIPKSAHAARARAQLHLARYRAIILTIARSTSLRAAAA